MGQSTLIGYFAEKDEARLAYKGLAAMGGNSLILIQKNSDGEIHQTKSLHTRLTLVLIIAAMCCAGVAGFTPLVAQWLNPLSALGFHSLPFYLSSATFLVLAGLIWLQSSVNSVEQKVIQEQSRLLLAGESVLVLQAPAVSLHRSVRFLHERSDIPPQLFLFHPRHERRSGARQGAVHLSPAQISEYASSYAVKQKITQPMQNSTELLKRLKKSPKWVRHACEVLAAARRLEQKASETADWILDNEYILEGNVRDVLRNLSKRFLLKLPALASPPYMGMPSIYGLAKDLVSHTDLRLDRENILAFIHSYQKQRTLTIGELWAIPQMLRIALIESIQNMLIMAQDDLRERQMAEFWANRLLAANNKDANTLFALLAVLSKKESLPSPYFSSRLIGLLYEETSTLSLVQDWLERVHKKPLHELNLQEQKRQTHVQLSCGNGFSSLRQIALLDWREMFEELNRVEQILRGDPGGIYPRMDFTSRDRCRQAIEELAYNSARPEEDIARAVIKLATLSATESRDESLKSQVATWLIGGGRGELARRLSCPETFYHRTLAWIYSHHSLVYFAAIGTILTLFFAALSGTLHTTPLLTPWKGTMLAAVFFLLVFLPLSQLAIDMVNFLITRLLPPRLLPKMDFSETGIPDEFKTLVVVPIMLADEETIRNEVLKLEIRYLANKEDNLYFSLFSDYTDADTPTRPDDAQMLKCAVNGIEEMNRRYREDRFFLFHRQRSWSESEGKFIGWERKRGKLEELNNLIVDPTAQSGRFIIKVGDRNLLGDIRFILTLDSDTRLPHATARRLVETLAHPLNRPRFAADGTIAPGSYTIIQPRVSPTLESSNTSLFSRLFSDPAGIDPYTTAVSDVYQDMSGEGSYQGKGIYDVRAFSRSLSGRFPEGRILSHDLIEGAHVRVGLASDIELYDDFPAVYSTYSKRNHRWIRGDWQIAAWLFPLVPQAGGGRIRTPLSLLNRWKIFDNLRRSLVPAATVGLLLSSWFLAFETGMVVTLLVVLQLLFHAVSHHLTMAISNKRLRQFSFSKLRHDVLRACVDAAFLPSQAIVSADAVIRGCYRCMISKRHLLEWTSETTASSTPLWRSLLSVSLISASIFSIVMGVVVWLLHPGSFLLAAPWLVLWFFGPVFGHLFDKRVKKKQKKHRLSTDDKRFLRHTARRTWRYFSAFVNDDSNWLPPDNYQVAHQDELAMRTSPTNIGLWMTSAIGAYDAGYLPITAVVLKLSATMATIGRLQRHRGHLLNWYDISTLEPLEPRYVSTVDSGNMLGCLWALCCGLKEIMGNPLLDANALDGLADTMDIFQQESAAQEIYCDLSKIVDQHRNEFDLPPSDILGLLGLLRSIEPLLNIKAAIAETPSWAGELQQQMEDWTQNNNRYLHWIEILAEKSEDELSPLNSQVLSAIHHDLQRAPSLAELACGKIGSLIELKAIQAASPQNCRHLMGWLDRLIEEFSKSQWLAGETLGQIEQLLATVEDLAGEMKMNFLYDKKRKLFAIGYNVTTNCLDTSRYDLLASEARLGSFVAIARGDVPLDHWFTLGRLYGSVGGKRILLSWTGTMFEYLMPLLFQRSYTNSLLHKAAREAVAVQIDYGNKNSVPWGFSESAFANLDLNKTYQYKAFGVAALALKRTSEEQLVVSPYAALLALDVAPGKTLSNLKKMTRLGLLGEYGYYESIDFSRSRKRHGSHGVIVEAYMAHHQGMAFLALINFLYDQPFVRRFHNKTQVRAFEPLLQERIPSLPPLHLSMADHRESPLPREEQVLTSSRLLTTPHTLTPRTLLFSNGRYSLMVTNSGGGYSQWDNLELSRWRSDQTTDAMGTFCYIYEADKKCLWSTTYHPTGGDSEDCSAEFSLDRALFKRVNDDLHSEMEIIVSQEDDVEIRRITLINHSSRKRTLQLTSYIELSMAAHNADRQHPAFNKIFIQTEALTDNQVLLAYRRQRSEHDPALVVAHRLFCNDNGDSSSSPVWQFETDRGQFIGRGHTLANPMGATQHLGGTQGYVLDPSLSVQKKLTLEPGQRTQVIMLLTAAATRVEVLELMDKYSDPHAVERAMEFTWRSAQQVLQVLQIQPDEARRFQHLASHLLYPNRLLRASARRLQENRKGQAGLWPYGISGDLPLILVTIGEVRDIILIRQLLQAHTYLRMQGLPTDLLILNEEAAGYTHPLQERLEQIIQVYALSAAVYRGGSVYLLQSAQVPEQDSKLLMAAASVVMNAAGGTLPQQLAKGLEVVLDYEELPDQPIPRDPSAALPFLKLHYFNSLGGFTQDGSEYAIYLGPDICTPAPWVNVIANPLFGTLISETGSGFTWFGNSQRNRLTGWSNDPVIDPPSEAVYIRDEESLAYWTPTAAPIREETAYRARHGAGYTVFEHNSHGIEQELTVFVPVNDDGGAPVKLQSLRLINSSSRPRRLSVTYYVELTLGETRETSGMHVLTEWDADTRTIMARNYFHPEYADRVTFISISPQAESYGCDRTTFIGRNSSLTKPVAMKMVELSGHVGAGLDPCASLRVTVEIQPNEARRITCLLGQSETIEEARTLVERFNGDESFAQAYKQSKSWWDNILGTIKVDTPELAVNLLVNRWLVYQSLSCRIWGRSGFYQSGGAFGFRDQLQDVMAILYARPEIARKHILLSASRQFKEGDVQHWWHEPSGAGIRSRISDDLLWLPHVVAQYVRVTGDTAILEITVPFLDGPELEEDQHEFYFTPKISSEQGTLFEHCQRAVNRGLTQSTMHGLPCIGTGDWNDGMNLVGAKGKGESIWLAWFLSDLLERMAEMATVLDMPERSAGYRQDRADLIGRIEKAGWDGKWYLRGTFDDGSPLGSAASREAKIDSLPQSWAWLSGSADRLRAKQAMESAWEHLVLKDEGVVLLFTPPFDTVEPSPGYIRGYPPGVRENGGQYTHAALWMAMAMARMGDGERAATLLRFINPIEHARHADSVWHYQVEPYAVAADVYRLPGRVGQGGWTWYTGSAAWMYRAWIEDVLGLQVRGDEMYMNPVFPDSWKGFSLRFQYGEAVYQIEVKNPHGCGCGVDSVTLDGQLLTNGIIALEKNCITHHVVVSMSDCGKKMDHNIKHAEKSA